MLLGFIAGLPTMLKAEEAMICRLSLMIWVSQKKVGIKCKDGTIMGVEKLTASKMMLPGSSRRNHSVHRHAGMLLWIILVASCAALITQSLAVNLGEILAWNFSNSKFSRTDSLITTGLPSFVLTKDSIFKSKGFIASLEETQNSERESAEMEWELEYWPHRITCQEIEAATNGFSKDNVIGVGGNGKVYQGVLTGGAEVAVK